jgi:hypothetical protein
MIKNGVVSKVPAKNRVDFVGNFNFSARSSKKCHLGQESVYCWFVLVRKTHPTGYWLEAREDCF